MAISFAQAQAALLADNFLDRIGETAPQVGGEVVQLDNLAKTVIRAAAEFTVAAKENLQQRDQVSSGRLQDSIRPVVVELGNNNIVDIYVAEYYKYLDKGVRGYKGAGSGEFQFRTPFPSRKMVTEIQKWMKREGLAIRNTKVAINPREGRRLAFAGQDTGRARAFAVAMAVKKKGIKGSKFWTDAIRALEEDFANDVAQALRIDVIEEINPDNAP